MIAGKTPPRVLLLGNLFGVRAFGGLSPGLKRNYTPVSGVSVEIKGQGKGREFRALCNACNTKRRKQRRLLTNSRVHVDRNK